MRSCAVALTGALATVLASCATPDSARAPSPAPSARAAKTRTTLEGRRELLRRARVWQPPPQPIPRADLSTNPPGPGAFRADEELSCEFLLEDSPGYSPKFQCRLPGGDEIKVKYGRNVA